MQAPYLGPQMAPSRLLVGELRRPPNPPKSRGDTVRKRAREIKIRMTDDEYEKYLLLVEKSGLKRNEYGLHCLLNKEIFVMPELREILLSLKNIGNNLNQIARVTNTGKTPPLDVTAILERQVNELWQLLKRCGKVKV